MSVVSVADVEAASAVIVVGPRDVVTPLARDRAKELGVTIERRSVDTPRAAATPATLVPAVPAGPAGLATLAPAAPGLPVSGALYRRGAPIPAAVDPHARSAAGRVGGHVAVIGAGHVGSMTALRVAERDLFDLVTLVDIVPGLAAGLALDMWHAASLRGFATRIVGSEDMASIAGADYVVVTAGRARQPGMTRTDLTAVNSEIVSAVAEAIKQHAPGAAVVVVTNPLEEMTHVTQTVTGFPAERVVGMAGVLDTARFCSLVGLTGKAAPADVTAYALGSHGPEMVIPLSQAFAGSVPVSRLVDATALAAIVERARDSGAEVVGLLKTGSAYFAPAESSARMVAAMASGSDEVLTACVRSAGSYGIVDTRVGLPVRLGRGGVREIVDLALQPDELDALRQAAERIAARIAELP